MKKILIVAMTEDRVIGKDGGLPWHYPEDMEHFRQKTIGNSVLMGRKTYESLPENYKPLPKRQNIVLTRDKIETDKDIHIANNLDEAFKIAEKYSDKIYIIGGERVYKQTLDIVDKLIITEIHKEYKGDTYFPEWDKDNWKVIKRDDKDEISFVEYKRKSKNKNKN